jgi:DNA polymerase-3 subunit delta'
MMAQAGVTDSIINSSMRTEIESYTSSFPAHTTAQKIGAIMEARTNLAMNAAPLATCEALMCDLARK